MQLSLRSLAAITASICLSAALVPAQTSDFRVLPYQLNATTDGITLTWFTIDATPGTLTITGPGLAAPLVLSSAPVLEPVLDYQIQNELNAGGEFPFATTAIFESANVPARNYRHRIVVTGLTSDSVFNYQVDQATSTYSNTFRTAPGAASNRPLRFIAISDSETVLRGRTRFRDWAATTPQVSGSTGRPAGNGPGRDSYFVTETVGYQENLRQIELRQPDLLVMPGDLVEGTSTECQRRWDEFWRHNAGEYDDLLSGVPLVAAIGNNCIYNGGGAGSANPLVQYARQQWSAYFDYPSNNEPAAEDLYFRTDYGPITILTLCSVGSFGNNDQVAPPLGQGLNATFPENRDTNRAWLVGYQFGDIPDFNVGTAQWNWTVQQLQDARAAGQIIFVQWHHTPYSRGIHGTSVTSTQSGEAMRIYSPLLEFYRVAGVFCGHSEVSEMSYFDLNNDGYGIHLWDVGAAGDGLRGVQDAPGQETTRVINWRNDPLNREGTGWVPNPHSSWVADQDEPELWNGNQLISGGKHYGFLECDVTPKANGEFRVEFQYWHVFPLNAGDPEFTVTGYELRPYNNRVVLEGTADDLRPVEGNYVAFGNGCAGSAGVPTLTALTQPLVGTTLQVEVDGMPADLGAMITGFSNQMTLGGTPLPANLGPAGFPGCELLVDPITTETLFGTSGTAVWALSIPSATSLVGLRFYNQAAVIDIAAPGGVIFSAGGDARVGL